MRDKIILVIFLTLLASSCSRTQKQEEIATVNGAPIPLKDFQREVSLALKRDPSLKLNPETLEDQLETLIERKLMIQEAVKKGLSEDERFLDTIKTFWEQTLIRQLIDLKTKEWSDRLIVTDDEVKKHYERMGRRLTFRMVNTGDEKKALEAKERMQRGERVEGEETAGPLPIENLQWNNPLYSAFDRAVGEVALVKSDEGYSVIQVIKKEDYKAPPLPEIYSRIKEMLLEQKKQGVLEEWLHGLKDSAKVEVNTNLLNKVTDERK